MFCRILLLVHVLYVTRWELWIRHKQGNSGVKLLWLVTVAAELYVNVIKSILYNLNIISKNRKLKPLLTLGIFAPNSLNLFGDFK